MWCSSRRPRVWRQYLTSGAVPTCVVMTFEGLPAGSDAPWYQAWSSTWAPGRG